MKEDMIMPSRIDGETPKSYEAFCTYIKMSSATIKEISEAVNLSPRQVLRLKKRYFWENRVISIQEQEAQIQLKRRMDQHFLDLEQFRHDEKTAAKAIYNASSSLLEKTLQKIAELDNEDWQDIDPLKLALIVKHACLALDFSFQKTGHSLAIVELIESIDMARSSPLRQHVASSSDSEF